jgi:hypothetical protein
MGLTLVIFLFATGMRRNSYLLELFFFVPFGVYAFIIFWVFKMLKKHKDEQQNRLNEKRTYKELIFLILFFAILFRAIFLFTEPILSDDVNRFYWDGKISNQGINPYQYAPDADELNEFRDSEWENINNKDIPTLYPPLSQMVFATSYFIYPSIFSFKLLFTMFDILSIYMIFLILKNFKIDPRYSIIYAWSPLVIIEFAHSGHNDSLVLFLVLLSFWSLQRNMKSISSVALALAVLTKIYPIIFAPILFQRWGKKNVVMFFGIILLFYLPFVSAGAGLYRGTSIYIDQWIFNGSIFPVLVEILRSFNLSTNPILVAKIVIIAILSIALLYFINKSRKYENDTFHLLKFAFLLTGLFLILSPTVHPWYVIWVIPFLCIFKSRSWILLSGTVILSYSVYIAYDTLGIWSEIWWVKIIEYVPFYLLLFYESKSIRNSLVKTKNLVFNLNKPM